MDKTIYINPNITKTIHIIITTKRSISIIFSTIPKTHQDHFHILVMLGFWVGMLSEGSGVGLRMREWFCFLLKNYVDCFAVIIMWINIQYLFNINIYLNKSWLCKILKLMNCQFYKIQLKHKNWIWVINCIHFTI